MAKKATAPFKKPKPIEPDVLAVLHNLRWPDDSSCVIDGHCPIYPKVKKVLTALGGTWNRGAAATLFTGDGATLVRDAIAAGVYIDPKQSWQFFETPVSLAQRMVDTAVTYLGKGTAPYLSALEPSAGYGRIATELKRAGFQTDVIELDPEKVARLSAHDYNSVHVADFLQCDPPDTADAYHAIVMNPPFTGLADIAHVNYAYKFLAPGGILLAVMSTAWTYRRDKVAEGFRLWLDIHGDHENLPADTFAESGTTVCTTLVTITKPRLTPAAAKK